jgi:hypothetical protein
MAKPNVLVKRIWLLFVIAGLLVFLDLLHAQQEQRGQTSCMKVEHGENDSGSISGSARENDSGSISGSAREYDEARIFSKTAKSSCESGRGTLVPNPTFSSCPTLE